MLCCCVMLQSRTFDIFTLLVKVYELNKDEKSHFDSVTSRRAERKDQNHCMAVKINDLTWFDIEKQTLHSYNDIFKRVVAPSLLLLCDCSHSVCLIV